MQAERQESEHDDETTDDTVLLSWLKVSKYKMCGRLVIIAVTSVAKVLATPVYRRIHD